MQRRTTFPSLRTGICAQTTILARCLRCQAGKESGISLPVPRLGPYVGGAYVPTAVRQDVGDSGADFVGAPLGVPSGRASPAPTHRRPRRCAAGGKWHCFQQHRRVRRVSCLFFINIVAIANMSLFKSFVFINIVGVTECFSSRPRGSPENIPCPFNSLPLSNLARNVCKCPRFINIVG